MVDFARAMRDAAPYICRANLAASPLPLKSSSTFTPSLPNMLSNAVWRSFLRPSAIGFIAYSTSLSTRPLTSFLTNPPMPLSPPSMKDGSLMPLTASLIHSGIPSTSAFTPAFTRAVNPSESVFPGEAP